MFALKLSSIQRRLRAWSKKKIKIFLKNGEFDSIINIMNFGYTNIIFLTIYLFRFYNRVIYCDNQQFKSHGALHKIIQYTLLLGTYTDILCYYRFYRFF